MYIDCYVSVAAFVASSGLAAISMIAQTLKSGDRILCMNDVYEGEYINNLQVHRHSMGACIQALYRAMCACIQAPSHTFKVFSVNSTSLLHWWMQLK